MENKKSNRRIPWEVYEKDLNDIHRNKYDYSKVVWKGVDIKIIVICPCHGEFEIRPADHKKGRGCKICSKNKFVQYNKLSTNEFVIKSTSIHGDKYDYSKSIYEGANKHIIIICRKHGEFKQIPSNHYKYGCKKCSFENNIRNKKLNEDCKNNFVEKSNNIHNNKYDYSKSIYINAATKLIVICSCHGEFSITPNNHLRGKGCPLCGRINASKCKIKSYDYYYKIFLLVHNDTYSYEHVKWQNACTKIDVTCKKHGIFQVLPYEHKNGRGCPSCNNQYSKKSIDWLNYLGVKHNLIIQHANNIGEKYIHGKTKADGYCKENNTIYEFHGDFWHGNPNLYDPEEINPKSGIKFGVLLKRTLHKELICRNLGFNYICIWENEWDKFIKTIKIIQKNYKLKRLL